MYPTLEKIKELAQSGEYRRIPVCRELYSDRYTPVEVMRTLRTASRHCYLLESASQTEVWGRYSFLGYEPSMGSPVQTESFRSAGSMRTELKKKPYSR